MYANIYRNLDMFVYIRINIPGTIVADNFADPNRDPSTAAAFIFCIYEYKLLFMY